MMAAGSRTVPSGPPVGAAGDTCRVRAANPLDEPCDLHRLQFRVEGWAVRTSPYADTTATRLGRHGEVAG